MEEEKILNTPEEQLQWMKNKYKQVKKTVDDMEIYLENFESIRAKLDDKDNWLEANFNWAKEQKEEIDKLYLEAKQTIQTLKTEIATETSELNSVKQLLASAKQSSEDCQSLKNEISNLKTSSKSNDTVINNLLTKSQANSDNIDSLLKKAETDVKNIQNFLVTFNNLKWEIEDENKWFEAIIWMVNENLNKSNSLIKAIEEARNSSNQNLIEIVNEKKTILWISEDVKKIKSQSEEDYNEIKKYLDIASDASFAESFKDRKKEHRRSALIWMIVLILSVFWLVWYLIWIFLPYLQTEETILPWLELTIFRVSLSSPLLFFIRFAWSEYSKSKKNEEKYAFKFATSSVFRNHIKFLLENFWEDRKWEVLETTQNIIDMLYTPTYPSDDKLSKTEKEIIKKYVNQWKWKNKSWLTFDEALEKAQKIKDFAWINQDTIKAILTVLFKQ